MSKRRYMSGELRPVSWSPTMSAAVRGEVTRCKVHNASSCEFECHRCTAVVGACRPVMRERLYPRLYFSASFAQM
eukprot:6543909-Prymnesium_polylepis.2